MNQFLKYVFIFTLPLLITCISVELLLRRIPNDYSYKRKYLDHHSNSISVLILGSSHAYYGIKPENTTASFNAAYISQSLLYDLRIIEKYEQKWDSLKYIVIPVDYFSLYTTLETSVEAWRVKNYNIYYKIHTSYRITDNTELFSNTAKINIKKLLNFYIDDNYTITSSKLGWGTTYGSSKKRDLNLTGIEAAARHRKKNDEYFEYNLAAIQSIINFAKKENIKILFYTSPAYKSYVQNLDDSQLNKTINTITQFTKVNSNVYYYNFLPDTSFTENDFYDADHLNEIGAKKLTEKINRLILHH